MSLLMESSDLLSGDFFSPSERRFCVIRNIFLYHEKLFFPPYVSSLFEGNVSLILHQVFFHFNSRPFVEIIFRSFLKNSHLELS